MKPYLEGKDTVLAEMKSSMEGLTGEEAAARLTRDGPNKLKEGKKESLLSRFIGELKDPMTIVLIVAAAVSAVAAIYAGESLTDTIIIRHRGVAAGGCGNGKGYPRRASGYRPGG